MPESRDYGSSQALLKHIKDRRDDIDCICIPLFSHLEINAPDGTEVIQKNAGAIIKFCDGQWATIHFVDAELLLNDGILHDLRIPIRLIPEGQTF